MSKIEWTDKTWNPVTGCTKISPGCKHCYAEVIAERWRGIPGHAYEQGFDLKLWPERATLPFRWKKPRMIFVCSMSDLFHKDVPTDFIQMIWTTMRVTPHHTYQVLTKRPERMESLFEQGKLGTYPNIWLGTSIESREYLWRIDHLCTIEHSIRFLSVEPLIESVSLGDLEYIDWVIVGGESGHGARPMNPDWVRKIRDQCLEQKVPFFFKQWGGVNKAKTGRILDGRTWDQMPGESND